MLQFAMLPYPGVYSSASLPLGVIGDRRSRWLIVVAPLWVIVGAFFGMSAATLWGIVLPIVVLVIARHGHRLWELAVRHGYLKSGERVLTRFSR